MTSSPHPPILFFKIYFKSHIITFSVAWVVPEGTFKSMICITFCNMLFLFKRVLILLPNPHTGGPPLVSSLQLPSISGDHLHSQHEDTPSCGDMDRLNMANLHTFWLNLSLYSYWKQNSVVSAVGQYWASLLPLCWNWVQLSLFKLKNTYRAPEVHSPWEK